MRRTPTVYRLEYLQLKPSSTLQSTYCRSYAVSRRLVSRVERRVFSLALYLYSPRVVVTYKHRNQNYNKSLVETNRCYFKGVKFTCPTTDYWTVCTCESLVCVVGFISCAGRKFFQGNPEKRQLEGRWRWGPLVLMDFGVHTSCNYCKSLFIYWVDVVLEQPTPPSGWRGFPVLKRELRLFEGGPDQTNSSLPH